MQILLFITIIYDYPHIYFIRIKNVNILFKMEEVKKIHI